MITHIVLVLTLIMAGRTPDVTHRVEQQGTIDDCWSQARAFVAQPLPKVEGVVGVAGACAVYVDGDNP
jgi:hypothetical protein